MFGFHRSRFDKRSPRAGLVRSSLGLEVLEGLALPSAVLPVPDASPELAAEVRQQDYSAIAFVGGWGSSMYQYAHNDPASGGVNVLLADGSVRFLKDTTAQAGDARPTEEVAFYYNKIAVHDATIANSGYIKIKKLNSGG